MRCFGWATALCLTLPCSHLQAQSMVGPDAGAPAMRRLIDRIVEDQSLLAGSAVHVRKQHLAWVIPATVTTALLVAADRHFMDTHIHSNPEAIARSESVSNVSLAVLAAIPAGLYGFGLTHSDRRMVEGAILAGEAAANAAVSAQALKAIFRRSPPTVSDPGAFFHSPLTEGSFPSSHSMVSWAIASALAHRYPGWLTKTLVYSLAAGSSVPRITAEKHFPSDVFVGSVLGWLIGREIYDRRHIDWNPVTPVLQSATPRKRTAKPTFEAPEREKRNVPSGPVIVPMDSWVYAVLDRLAAMGYITSAASGLRPWTRSECLRQLSEAEIELAHGRRRNLDEALRLVAALREEFGRERDSSRFMELESLYGRLLGISGKPLVDGYNFGQTLVNDYGRPYGEGVNAIAGFSADVVDGRFSFYTRSEYQHAAPSSSPALDLKPQAHELEPILPSAPNGVDRFVPLALYAGAQFGGWALTVGKQELWWGPGTAGPLSFSTDAEPFSSFRLTSTTPIVLPGLLRYLGGFRLDLIGGELSGHHLPAKPLLNGQKLTWNITKNLELGFTRWSLFDGAGVHGFNLSSVLRNILANGATFGQAVDPGDRKSGFDFKWRLPWYPATIYCDFYADDEPSPLTSPRRSGFSPGLYLGRLPGLTRWDLRVEVPSTRLPLSDQGGFFLYWNGNYNDSNTNRGNLLGSWVGRDGRGLWVESTYWRSARSGIRLGYRENRIGPAYMPGGGTQSDGWVSATFLLKPQFNLVVSTQYERYWIPVMGGPKQNLTASAQLIYTPHWWVLHN